MVKHIIEDHPEVRIIKPKKPMWKLIVENGIPPTRIARYCCKELKERSFTDRLVVTGVRKAESVSRAKNQGKVSILNGGKKNQKIVDAAEKNGIEYETTKNGRGVILNYDNDGERRVVEQCYRTYKTLINPIIDWSDEDVWEFIHERKLPYCKLYDEGYKRLGCVGCPMNTNAAQELERFPSIKKIYLMAFEKMLEENKRKGKKYLGWETAQDVMDWWIGNTCSKQIEGQMSMMDERGEHEQNEH